MHAYSFTGDRIKALGLVAVVAVVIAVVTSGLYARLNIGPAWLFSAPTVGAAYGIAYQVLDRSAWSWTVMNVTGVVSTPDLNGRYEGKLTSSFQGRTEIDVAVTVEQTWTRILVRLEVMGNQSSESQSLAAAVAPIGRSTARLTYVFRNMVRPGFAAPDMNDHDGTAELTIDASSGTAAGRYYNFRGRQGTLDLRRV